MKTGDQRKETHHHGERKSNGRVIVGNVIHILNDAPADDTSRHSAVGDVQERAHDETRSSSTSSLPFPLAREASTSPSTAPAGGFGQRQIIESGMRPQAPHEPIDVVLPAPPPSPDLASFGEEWSEPREAWLPPAEHAPAALPPTPAVEPEPPGVAAVRRNRVVVSTYKALGFAILGAILLGLASFIFTNVFYMVNCSWATPLMLSSTDPRVIELSAQLSATEAARDAVESQRLQLQSQLDDARRIQASEERFQASFQKAMDAEAQDRGSQLTELQHLLDDLTRTRTEVAETSRDYTAISKEELEQESEAGLIGKDESARGGLELSQIAGQDVAIEAKQADVDARIAELRRAVGSLRGSGAASYEVLHMRHEYAQSVLASQKAAGEADALQNGLAMIQSTLAAYDAQIARLRRAPYVMAADKSVTTAFVPYDNAASAKVGDDVYSCAVGPLFCTKVGRVAEILDGEVIDKHPLHNREIRGVLVRLELTDGAAVQHAVLHLHRRPLFV
jgi:hypothetical protein